MQLQLFVDMKTFFIAVLPIAVTEAQLPTCNVYAAADTSLGGEVVGDIEYILSSPWRLDTESALWLGGIAVGIGGLFLADNEIQDAFQDNRTNASNDIARIGSTHWVIPARNISVNNATRERPTTLGGWSVVVVVPYARTFMVCPMLCPFAFGL